MSDDDSEPEAAARIVADAILSVGRVNALCPPGLDCVNLAEAVVVLAAVFKNEIAPALNRIAEAMEERP